MSEVKQTNFRISASAANAFRTFCEEQGINQAQGFDHLLEVLALDQARTSIQSRETEISNFEQHAKALIGAYLHSLELNENAEARIREQFTSQLESQARTISDYQNQVTELQTQVNEAVSLAEDFQSDVSSLQDSLNDIEEKRRRAEEDLASIKDEKEKQLTDKDNIIAMLSEKLLSAEQKADGYDDLKGENVVLKAELAEARQTIKDNDKDAQIALERALRAAEKVLEAEHRKELEKLRSQNTELLQTIAAVEKTNAEQIRAIEKENATLREKLASYKKK